MKLNKILHISPTDIRYDSRILKELEAIKKLPDSVIFAFGINDREGHKYDSSFSNVKTFDLLSKKMKCLPRPIRYFFNTIEAFFKFIVPMYKFNPSIIHCHDTLYLPIAIIGKYICKSKIIYDAHELESDKAGQSKILSSYTLLVEKISWKNIDLLISVSQSIINWYNSNIGTKGSLLILNSPLMKDKDLTIFDQNYFRNKFNIPTGKKIFLYLGIISQEGRGIDLYLDVFRKVNIDSHIIFVGYGDYAEMVIKISREYPNIHYHDAVPHNEVVEISKSADVGLCMLEKVSLSDYYCLPNKLFEYAFSGLYILATGFPDIKHIVESYNLGKTCSFNEIDFEHAVKSIESMSIQKNINNLYPLSWEYQSEKLYKEYIKLLNINKN